MRRVIALAFLSVVPLSACSEGVIDPHRGMDDPGAAATEAIDFAPVAALADDALLHDLIGAVQDPALRNALYGTLADLAAAAELRDPVAVARVARGPGLAAYADVESLGDADRQTLGALRHTLDHVRWWTTDARVAP